MIRIKHFLFGMLFLSIYIDSGFAQIKVEREFRIKKEEVPNAAREFLQQLPFDGKVKWYYEENLENHSVEAKVNYQNHLHSIEFDTLGQLQDIEVKLSWKELDQLLLQKMIHELDSVFTSCAIRKIQRQFSGKQGELLDQFKSSQITDGLKVQYELIVKGNPDNRPFLYEATFSEEGELLDLKKIVFKNTDNLVY